MSSAKYLELLQAAWKHIYENGRGFDRVMNKMKVVEGSEGRCVTELKVEEEHTNKFGTLHGGLSSTLVDLVSTMALLTHPRQAPGVSVDLHVTFLKAAKIGEDILVDAKIEKVGKTLAFLSVDIKNKATGDLIVRGSHTKFIAHQ